MNHASKSCPTVLVVEDIDWIRVGMKRYVERYGFKVLVATGDDEAISIAEHTPPDLVLTEEELPTFHALMDQLRNHPTLSHIPVVIVNPDAEENTRFGDALVLSDFGDLEGVITSTRRQVQSA
jgi:CheY-like chemotaxis protein